MAKKNTGNPAFKGTISSVILSIFVLFLFLLPVFVANGADKVRMGNGKYNFKDSICYDIDGSEDFEDDPDIEAVGEGALGYMYENEGVEIILTEISIMDYPLNGTVDEYGVGLTADNGEVECSVVLIFLTLTKDDIIDMDVTRIDIYFNVSGLLEDDSEYEVYLSTIEDCPDGMELGEITAGELNEIEIDVAGIMEINAFEEDEGLVLAFIPTEEEGVVQPENTIIFDMQMYCIEEIKIPSLTKIGIWMLGISAFMIFCGVIMLPEVTFDGLIESIKKRV